MSDEPARKKPTSAEIAWARQRVYDGEPEPGDALLLSDFIGDMFTHGIEQQKEIDRLKATNDRVEALAEELEGARTYVFGKDLLTAKLRQALAQPEGNTVRWNVCPDCFDSHGGNACYDESAEPSPGQEADQPAHGGGNAEDCPICSGLDLPYPFICTAHDEAHAAFAEHFKDAATWTEEAT